jgi:hypothetical protein
VLALLCFGCVCNSLHTGHGSLLSDALKCSYHTMMAVQMGVEAVSAGPRMTPECAVVKMMLAYRTRTFRWVCHWQASFEGTLHNRHGVDACVCSGEDDAVPSYPDIPHSTGSAAGRRAAS